MTIPSITKPTRANYEEARRKSTRADYEEARIEARERLAEVLAELVPGFQPERGNFHCLNPDHPDAHPSMQYRSRANKVYCYGCGWTGDVFDVVGMVFGLSTSSEAFKKTYELLDIDPSKKMKAHGRELSRPIGRLEERPIGRPIGRLEEPLGRPIGRLEERPIGKLEEWEELERLEELERVEELDRLEELERLEDLRTGWRT